MVGAFVLLMAVPLGVSGVQLYRQTTVVAEATPIAQQLGRAADWQITDVQFRGNLWITATGPAPNIDPASLRRDLTAAGLGDVTLEVQLLDGGIQQVNVPYGFAGSAEPRAGGGAHALATRAAHDRGAS